MGSVDDVRKAMQDFLAPDLKALAVRLEALEKEMRAGFAYAEKMEVGRFSSAEKLAAMRQETLLATMAANYANIMNTLEMEKRLTRLESERKGEPSHA